jgi:hypothetical protein
MSRKALGLDIGLARDRSVVAEVRRHAATGLVVVEAIETWTPHPGVKVDLRDVEDFIAARAGADEVVLDPWQGVLMAQRLRGRNIQVIEYPFTGESRRELFGTLLDLICTGRLRCRPHDELRRELLGLEVHETTAGWRVDHRVGRHDDHVVAVALAAQHVMAVPEFRCSWCADPTCRGWHAYFGGLPPRSVAEQQRADAERDELARAASAAAIEDAVRTRGAWWPGDGRRR